jgi:hypothetical protein
MPRDRFSIFEDNVINGFSYSKNVTIVVVHFSNFKWFCLNCSSKNKLFPDKVKKKNFMPILKIFTIFAGLHEKEFWYG